MHTHMDIKQQHIVFYDGTCGMCHFVVQFLLKHDTRGCFVFAPLQGITAASELSHWRNSYPLADTLVLIENYQDLKQRKILAFGKGALRICWLLGGAWKIIGILSFLPSCLYDWGYRWVASHRFQWFERQTCLIPKSQDIKRFLP